MNRQMIIGHRNDCLDDTEFLVQHLDLGASARILSVVDLPLGGVGQDAVLAAQDAADVPGLQLLHVERRLVRARPGFALQAQVADVQNVTLAHGDCVFQDGQELSDVARPGILL